MKSSMNAPLSYGGYLLEIDLSRKSVKKVETPKTLCRNLLGGKGFGTQLLYERVGGDVDLLSPDNLLTVSYTHLTLPTTERV